MRHISYYFNRGEIRNKGEIYRITVSVLLNYVMYNNTIQLQYSNKCLFSIFGYPIYKLDKLWLITCILQLNIKI